MSRIPIIDTHTGGGPTRVVLGGVTAENLETYRRATLREPRGPHREHPLILQLSVLSPTPLRTSARAREKLRRLFTHQPQRGCVIQPRVAEPWRGYPGFRSSELGSKPSTSPHTTSPSSACHQQRPTPAPKRPPPPIA